MKKALELATKVAQKLDTEIFNDIGFESTTIDGIKFDAVNIDGNIDVTAQTWCNGNRIVIANSNSNILLHSIATCIMNMLGFQGEWSFNSIQAKINEKTEKNLEWSEFCESLGWDN